MRLAAGLLMHEADIFSPVRTTVESCRQSQLLFGEDILRFHRDKGTELAGVIRVAAEEKVTLIPTLSAFPIPGGVFTNEAYSFLKGELLARLARAGELDGVLLVLHGSAASEDLDDVEGDLLAAVRDQVGGEIPIVVTLDFHANLSAQMVEHADAIIGYKTCAHVDQVETGERAIRLMLKLLRRKIKPVMVLEKIPMLIPYSGTGAGPMKQLMDRAGSIEREEGVLSVSLFDSQAESGMRELGRSVVVVAEDASADPKGKAAALRDMWWGLRRAFRFPRIAAQEAVAMIKGPQEEPLILVPRGDDPFSGAPGDGPFMLKALIENRVERAAVAVIPDPESVDQAIRAGVGGTVTLRIGGKMDNIHNSPCEVTGTVTHITSGRYVLEGTALCDLDMGRAVALRVDDTDIVLTENRMPAWDPDFLRLFGIEPKEKRVLVLRACGPRWREIRPRVIGVDTPGCFNSRLILDWIKQEKIQLAYNYLEPEA